MKNLTEDQAKTQLLKLLHTAYANEQAAARAYSGHSKGLFIQSQERQQIHDIAQAEQRHFRTVKRILEQLHARLPNKRAKSMRYIGNLIGFLCIFGGKLIPMYGAGWLESDVINIYVKAAQCAWLANHQELVPELLEMAEEEWDHEHYFRTGVENHWLGKRLKIWPKPEPREHLRTAFARFCQQQRKQRIYSDLQQVKSAP